MIRLLHRVIEGQFLANLALQVARFTNRVEQQLVNFVIRRVPHRFLSPSIRSSSQAGFLVRYSRILHQDQRETFFDENDHLQVEKEGAGRWRFSKRSIIVDSLITDLPASSETRFHENILD